MLTARKRAGGRFRFTRIPYASEYLETAPSSAHLVEIWLISTEFMRHASLQNVCRR